jgi:hypothetical protein
MMHPAMRHLRRLMKKHGFAYANYCQLDGKVLTDDYPCYVSLESSAHDNKYRVIVDGLSDRSSVFLSVRAIFHKMEFSL